jgi:hypothetical protein
LSAQESDVPGPVVDLELRREVVRRASQLCLRAEPHTDESPCAMHLNEANRQLLGLPD